MKTLFFIFAITLSVSAQTISGGVAVSGGVQVIPLAGGFTPFDAALNFRLTDTFVTDGAGQTYVLGGPSGDVFPTTRGSVTFGWLNVGTNQGRDRNAGVDPRFAGLNFTDSLTEASRSFQVTLPAPGTYDIRAAMGDISNAQSGGFEIKDNMTPIWSVATTATASGSFMDANGTVHTAANWPANNTAKNLTFASTTFILILNASAPTHTLAHLRIVRTS